MATTTKTCDGGARRRAERPTPSPAIPPTKEQDMKTTQKTTKKTGSSKVKASKGTVRKSRPLAVAVPHPAEAGGSALAEDRLSEGAKKDLAAARAKAAAPDAQIDADVQAAKKIRPAKKGKAGKAKGPRKPSLIALAAEVLREAKEPMDCKAIVEKVLAKGTWTTSGKTPAATLYSAIIREIAKAGDKARFRKVDKGQFELAAAAK
jgi:hypothetical protein